jgi:light-regulated signal transduction histidine kinase (bacteriophytochrome)
VEELREHEPARQVEVLVGELPDAIADPGLLKQVFVNLLSNAFKFTRRRETAMVEVGSLQQGNEIVYFVRDNGSGFEMKYVSRLFGVFERLHNDGQFEGTGIGLSVVRRIIERHGGRVWAEGEVEEGATFSFSLPSTDMEPSS